MENDVLAGLDEVVEAPDAPAPEAAAPDIAAKVEPDKVEPAKPAAKAPDAPANEPQTIPLAAHLEERNKHKQESAQFKSQLKALQDQLAKLSAPPKVEPPAAPDFTADPKAYVDHSVKSVLEKLETGQTELKKTTEQVAQETGFTRFQHDLRTTEQQFHSQNPDYYEALIHLRTLRVQELSTLNPELTQEQVVHAMNREELQLAHQLMSAGRNPHQVAYQLAKARGYTKKDAAAAANVLPDVPKPNQLPPDQTLGTGSGAPNSGETFLNDDEVFEKAFNEMFGRKRA